MYPCTHLLLCWNRKIFQCVWDSFWESTPWRLKNVSFISGVGLHVDKNSSGIYRKHIVNFWASPYGEKLGAVKHRTCDEGKNAVPRLIGSMIPFHLYESVCVTQQTIIFPQEIYGKIEDLFFWCSKLPTVLCSVFDFRAPDVPAISFYGSAIIQDSFSFRRSKVLHNNHSQFFRIVQCLPVSPSLSPC